ncbi:MAG: hypothetical protein R3Y06_09810 [Faecalibacterium sp.]
MILTQKFKKRKQNQSAIRFTTSFKQLGTIFIASSTVFFSFFAPNACKAAILAGYETCISQLLFALFPFLIAANLLVTCGFTQIVGRPLKPLCKLLGFSETAASGVFAIALLGGFAPAVSALALSVKSAQISAQKASLFLPMLCFFGPSYIILAVGQVMLSNFRVGVYLFVSQVLAGIFTVLIFQVYFAITRYTRFLDVRSNSPSNPPDISAESTTSTETSIPTVIADSFFAFLRLCGIILYFQFLSAGFSSLLPTQYRWVCEVALEVTAACESIAAVGTQASFRCCAALSLLSGSILLQIRALCPRNVSIKPLLYARLLHLPLSLVIFRLFLCIPQTQSVYNSLNARVLIMQRQPLDQALLLFVALIFLAERLAKPLQRR